MTKRKTINEKIDAQFRRWCDLLPSAALSDAGVRDAWMTIAPAENQSKTTNEYLNAWEDVVFRMPRENEDHVNYDDPNLSIEAIGKLRIMAMVANMMKHPATQQAKLPDARKKYG